MVWAPRKICGEQRLGTPTGIEKEKLVVSDDLRRGVARADGSEEKEKELPLLLRRRQVCKVLQRAAAARTVAVAATQGVMVAHH